jgi:heme A synthase
MEYFAGPTAIITIAFLLWAVVDELEVSNLYSRRRSRTLKAVIIVLFILAIVQVWMGTITLNERTIEQREQHFKKSGASFDP